MKIKYLQEHTPEPPKDYDLWTTLYTRYENNYRERMEWMNRVLAVQPPEIEIYAGRRYLERDGVVADAVGATYPFYNL